MPRSSSLRKCALAALVLLAPTTLALAPAPPLDVEPALVLPVRLPDGVDVAHLAPFDPRAPALAARDPDTARGLFTGHLASTSGLVRLVEWEGTWTGLVDAPRGLTWVTLENGTLVPLPEDAVPREDALVDAELVAPEGASGPRADPAGRDGVLQLLLDGDATYARRYENVWKQHQLAVITLVDAVYVTNLGVPLEVVEQHAWTDGAGPLTGRIECSGSPDDLLVQFREHWEAVAPTVEDAREAAHLFSMRPLAPHPDGGTLIGCGFVAALESPFAYAASHVNPPTSLAYDAMLVAHELGHNFGGLHSRAFPSPSGSNGCPPTPTVMYPYLCRQTLPAFTGAWGTGLAFPDGGNAPWMRAHAEARV